MGDEMDVEIMMRKTAALLALSLACLLPAAAQAASARSNTVREEVLIDNADVRVTRVTIPPGATQIPSGVRAKRVIVWLTPNKTERHAKKEDASNENKPEDRGERLAHKPGDAVFRTSSKHSITNLTNKDEVSLIVELKH